jgi:hypothetical protein
MKSFEDHTHAFIVRVWLEQRELESALPEWRGMVEHVASGKRRYFTDLNEINDFIADYLEGIAVNRSKFQEALAWLKNLKLDPLRRH